MALCGYIEKLSSKPLELISGPGSATSA